VRWEPLGRNHGFARGNNIAASLARGEILLFVNNDMRFAPSFVRHLVRPLGESGVFATDARQYDWGGTRDIHRATRLVPRTIREALHAPVSLPLLHIDQIPVHRAADVVQACAANMAVHRWMFHALGGFDERFPAGWEDTDICWRAWLRGWRTLHVPGAVCWHRVGAASARPEGAEVRSRGASLGRLLFAMKHLPPEHALAVWAFAIGGTLRCLLRGDLHGAQARFGVLRESIRRSPAVFFERRQLYRQAGTSPRAHLRFLESLIPKPS
jgi:GT2 family glycosyltransferase